MATKWLVGTDLGASASWGTADGGSGGAGVPSSTDDACVGPISFPSGTTVLTCTGNAASFRNLTMTNTGSVTIPTTATLNVYGDASLRNITNAGNYILFFAGSANHSLTTNGAYAGNIQGGAAGYTITCADNVVGYRCAPTGPFNFNGFNGTFTASITLAYATSSVSMQAGSFACSIINASNASAVLSAANASIECTGSLLTAVFPNGAAIKTLKFSGSNLVIQTSTAGNQINAGDLHFKGGATYLIQPNVTLTASSVVQDGSTSSQTIITRDTSGGWNLVCSGTVSLLNATVGYCTASGGGKFYVDRLKSTLTSCTGWLYNAFWIGGSGNPDAISKFSATSGGAAGVGGNTLPDANTDVLIDINSGFESGGTIGDSTSRALNCRSLTMTQGGIVTMGIGITINASGNVSLARVANTNPYTINIAGSRNHALTSNGSYAGTVHAQSNGYTLTLLDALSGENLYIEGTTTVDCNGKDVSLTGQIIQTGTSTINLGSGVIAPTGGFSTSSATVIVPGTADVRISDTSGATCVFPAGVHFATLRISSVGTIYNTYPAGGAITIDNLHVAAGANIKQQASTTWVLSNPPQQTGDTATKTTLQGSAANTWNWSCPGRVVLDNVSIGRGATAGGGVFCATSNNGLSVLDAYTTGWFSASPSESGVGILRPARLLAAEPSVATLTVADDQSHNFIIPYIQTSQTISVAASVPAVLFPSGGSVRFVLDQGTSSEREAFSSESAEPFTASFSGTNAGEHTLDVYIVDASRVAVGIYHDKLTRIAVGDIIVAIGDSTTAGSPYMTTEVINWTQAPAGTVSSGKRQFPQFDLGASAFRTSFLTMLADQMEGAVGRPLFVYNEGNSGYQILDTQQKTTWSSFQSRTLSLSPNKWMIHLGANDAIGGVTADTYKTRLQTLLTTLAAYGANGGNTFVAKPIYNNGSPAASSLESQYCVKIDELATAGLCVLGPDFYAHFLAHPEQQADGLHPNTDGYAACASLWLDAITSTANASAASAWLQFVMQ